MTQKKNVQNDQLLNAMHDTMSGEYKEKVPTASSKTGTEVYETLTQFPTLKNEFINTLTNRIGKQVFMSRAYSNPLQMLHRGMLPYGKHIEQLFVELVETKGFNDNFDGSDTPEGDLIRALPPSVKVDYISQNFEYKLKTSISEQQLRGAFTTANGLSDLITKTFTALSTGVYYKEYEDMKKILINAAADTTGGSTIGKGLVQTWMANPTTKANAIVKIEGTSQEEKSKSLAKKIRTYADKLSFISDKFNAQNVKTHTPSTDLVLFITPDAKADLDVDTLAFAFNIDKADVPVRTIVVDTLGDLVPSGKDNTVHAILCDTDLIQAYDTINETQSFFNAERLVNNIFAHKHGIMARCDFANAIIFHDGELA